MKPNHPKHNTRWMAIPILCFLLTSTAVCKDSVAPQLNKRGESIREAYAQMLDHLSAEISAELPEIDPTKKSLFVNSRAEESRLKAPNENAGPEAHNAYKIDKSAIEAKLLQSARELLSEIAPTLESEQLDSKLMKVAVLRHGTPAGLAEFAQQSSDHKALIDDLLGDDDLLRQVLMAGGANGGEYGESMQVYQQILDASENARQPGILQNLALGTALHQPWLADQERGSVNGIIFTDHQIPDSQVERYLHYEKSYLDH